MRTYGQYCPIARAAEILAVRWTPLILRNLLLGSTTFGQIADGAPGIPRSLLASRLRELERAGVVESRPNERGRGSRYGLTKAGEDLGGVMLAMGSWGERWLELAPEHLDPGVVLNSWVSWYLAHDRCPIVGWSCDSTSPIGLERPTSSGSSSTGTGRRSAVPTRATRKTWW